jgi:hypothetical protein
VWPRSSLANRIVVPDYDSGLPPEEKML